jgi:hypothetical protein
LRTSRLLKARADAIVVDLRGDLYAASDFGVMPLPFGTTTRTVADPGLPMVNVAFTNTL